MHLSAIIGRFITDQTGSRPNTPESGRHHGLYQAGLKKTGCLCASCQYVVSALGNRVTIQNQRLAENWIFGAAPTDN
jgi:hypothetical protein